jgi:1-acyl-sn-glycerol-3-phosphate acyltransferase
MPTPTPPSKLPNLPGLLIRNRDFVLIWAAYGISAIGDHLSEMALLSERGGFDRTDITRVQALLTFGFFLPYVLIGPLAGWWADRFSRKWTMIGADVLRAGVMISISVTVPFLIARGLGDYSIVLPLLLTGAFAAFFSPSRKALLPTLVRDDQLVRANAMISAMGTIGAIFSGWLGGKLVDLAVAGHFGLVWNYRLDAITFGISAVLLGFLSLRAVRVVPHAALTGVWTPIRAGFRYVRQHRRVLQMILLGTVFWGAGGVIISVVPAIVKEVFGGTFSDAGMYRGLIAAGLALGAALMTLLGPALPTPLAVLVGLFGGGVWVLGLDAAFVFKLGRFFSAFCLVMIGAHGAALLISITVVIQRLVPDSRRGRVFGVSDMATTGAMVLATGLLGVPHIPNLDLYIPFLLGVIGLGLLGVTWLAWRAYSASVIVSPGLAVLWYLLLFFTRFWCRARRDGISTIPHQGPVILAANHTAGVDPIVIQGTSPHRIISFIVAREYYDRPLAGWFMRQVGCVPIDRQNPGKSFLSGCLKLLKAGGCLGIFPQGTFVSPDEEQPEAKYGVGVLALRSGATVIPCHISGTRYRANPLAAFFVRHAVRIKYGRAVDLAGFRGREKDRRAAQEASELIMAKINELAQPDEEADGDASIASAADSS